MERCKSREQLDTLLAKLKTDLRAMLPGFDGIANFDVCVFKGEADAIADSVGSDERPCLLERLQCIWASVAPIPSDSEGQSCLPDRADKPEAAA
jgi:hypothetical protein